MKKMTVIQNNNTRKLWDRFWSSRKSPEDFYPGNGRLISLIMDNLPVRGKRILEVGAGTGQGSMDLAMAGARIFLLDYSEMAIDLLKQQRRENHAVCIVRGDALALPFKGGCMDIVFHQGLLEHFHEPKTVLNENNRVLNNKGWVLAEVPQKYHIYTLIKHLLMVMDAWFAGRETEFTVRRLKKTVQYTGFHIRRLYGGGMVPSFFYRALRMLLRYFHVTLPMYPKSTVIGSRVRKNIQHWFNKDSLLLNFCIQIGVMAEKADGPLK